VTLLSLAGKVQIRGEGREKREVRPNISIPRRGRHRTGRLSGIKKKAQVKMADKTTSPQKDSDREEKRG